MHMCLGRLRVITHFYMRYEIITFHTEKLVFTSLRANTNCNLAVIINIGEVMKRHKFLHDGNNTILHDMH